MLEKQNLSRDSVCINGLWLEEVVNGLTIISSTGREVLTKEITNSSYKRDGSVPSYKRYPERIITVEYILDGTDASNFRENCTQLYRLLDIEDADIQFNDEFDKFYVGSVSIDQPAEKKGLYYKGSFRIVCEDPFKYSTAVKTALPTWDGDTAVFAIDYKGTYPARPVLQAEFRGALNGGKYSDDGDCGYVVFVDDAENIIQLGNPDAIDLDGSKLAAQLQNNTLTSLSGFTVSGSCTTGHNITDPYWNSGAGTTDSYVSHSGDASFTYNIVGGAENFDLSTINRLCCNATTEVGSFYIKCYDSSNNLIVGFDVDKQSNGSTGSVNYYVGSNEPIKTVGIDLSYNNTHFGYCKRSQAYKNVNTTYYYNKKTKKWQTKKIKGAKTKIVKTQVTSGWTYTQSNLNISVSKKGGTYTIKLGNLAEESFTIGGTNAVAINKITVGFTGALDTNAIRLFKLTRNLGASFTSQDNIFTAGDIVQADCNDASVYIMNKGTLEGRYAPKYGALGNDWEEFMLQAGTNVIQFNYSSWVDPDYKPEPKIIYNEVFI